jgi:allophanate hydrolase subunit 1
MDPDIAGGVSGRKWLRPEKNTRSIRKHVTGAVTITSLVAMPSTQDYAVFAIGFRPGFPYAGYLPAGLSGLARRESPRLRVAAGSVEVK